MIFDRKSAHSCAFGFLRSVYSTVRIVRNILCTCLLCTVLNCEVLALSFSGPEVLKLDWSTRSLTVSDVDNDGLNDLIVINNDTAKIELLFQLPEDADGVRKKRQFKRNRWEPELEDARFEREAITIGFPLFDLAIGDLNGDGLDDLAYTGRERPLTVRFQGESGSWTEIEEFDGFEALGWTGTLKIADLYADGNAEMVVVSAEGLRIIEQGDDGNLHEKELYYITGQNPFNLIIDDVTRDNRADIIYVSSNGKQSLVLREQLKEGGFGPELRFPFEKPMRSIRVLPHRKGEPVAFCAIDSRSGSLEFFELERQKAAAEKADIPSEQPEVYPIFGKSKLAPSYAFGDLNSDGLEDILVANPGKAEVVLFLKDTGYFHSPQTFPSFSEISSMSYGHFFEGDHRTLAIVSAGESMMGISHMSPEGRIEFPRQLNIGEGDPLVCEAVDLDRDGYHELAFVSEADDRTTLILARPADRSDAEIEWIEIASIDLKDIRRKPSAIREIPAFDGNKPGLMVFIPREAPLFFSIDTADTLELKEIASTSNLRESLLKGVQPVQVSVIDIDADGRNEIVVGQKGYARALQIKGETLEMVDQFNARSSEDTVSTIIPVYKEGSVQQLVLYIEEAGEFQLVKRDADDVFRYETSVDVGRIELIDWYKLSNSQGDESFIFVGTDRFWNLTNGADVWKRVVSGSYETELEDVFYNFVESADFKGEGSFELIAVDGQNHVVEIISKKGDQLESQMFWEIFEQNLHYQGRNGSQTEPRQAVIADLTNDGKLDFAFLVHDRILFYPQR